MRTYIKDDSRELKNFDNQLSQMTQFGLQLGAETMGARNSFKVSLWLS